MVRNICLCLYWIIGFIRCHFVFAHLFWFRYLRSCFFVIISDAGQHSYIAFPFQLIPPASYFMCVAYKAYCLQFSLPYMNSFWVLSVVKSPNWTLVLLILSTCVQLHHVKGTFSYLFNLFSILTNNYSATHILWLLKI